MAKYTNENVYIACDFNVDLINPVNNELNCITNFVSHSYNSHIWIPTRVTDLSSTCLDHIWTNLDNVELSGVISDINVTDHFQSFILFSFASSENENRVKTLGDLHQETINNLCDVLQEFTNNFMINENDNVNVRVNSFMDSLPSYVLNVSLLEYVTE